MPLTVLSELQCALFSIHTSEHLILHTKAPLIKRRNFIKSAAAALAVLPLSQARAAGPNTRAQSAGLFDPTPANGWRTVELLTTLQPHITEGSAQVWLPLPSHEDPAWCKPMGNLWSGNASSVQLKTAPGTGVQILHAQWDVQQGEPPLLEVVSRVALRDRAVDFSRPVGAAELSTAERTLYTSASDHLPIDGIVLSTARQIIEGKFTDLDKARAIYEWIVTHTMRDPKVNGCGLGDIKWMLETGNLKGKCADLNTLYVGLARAVGLPSRDVYGVRAGESRYGYRSLGKGGDLSKAQHCRAEVYLPGHGWIAIDPSDVRKVMIDEDPEQHLALGDVKVQAVHDKLFGAWESNWVPYNVAHDVTLPGSSGEAVSFLMYPQGESADGSRFDSLDPEHFKYSLEARELKKA